MTKISKKAIEEGFTGSETTANSSGGHFHSVRSVQETENSQGKQLKKKKKKKTDKFSNNQNACEHE